MVLFEYSTSDEEYDMGEDENIMMVLLAHKMKNKKKKRKHYGSVLGHQKIRRLHAEADHILMQNYFGPSPIMPKKFFRRKFRMSSELFKKIAERMKCLDHFFQQRRSASGELGHNTYQKVTAALRQMAWTVSRTQEGFHHHS
jgi:hypothetical protein